MNKLIDALMVKPMEFPCITRLCTDRTCLDTAVSVDADVECTAAVLELSDGIGILYAWDAPALGLLGNRKVGKRIIPGIFYVVRYKNGRFDSLTPDDIAKYTVKFQTPQIFTHDELVDSWFLCPVRFKKTDIYPYISEAHGTPRSMRCFIAILRRLIALLYRIGTKKDLPRIASRVPERVFTEIVQGICILDAEYGADRDYLQSGGYALIVETTDDLNALREIVDYEVHPCEWVTAIGKDTGFLSCLFLMNDDFGIIAYMPRTTAPAAILNDLEE